MAFTLSKRIPLNDIFIGVIIALVSIPISMGYASVAGLPVVYGLYGSLLPVLLFGLISSSKRAVFGVDAAPAALVGGMLASLGIAAESSEALQIIPLITLLTSIWLFIFFLIKADRLLKFISQPVMGGFISGIGSIIILMQIPKLFGGSSGHGEVIELILHIVREARGGSALAGFNLPSFILGLTTISIILLCRKFCPKLPVQPILMFAGAAFSYLAGHLLQSWGIKNLPAVEKGLPPLLIPKVSLLLEDGNLGQFLLPSFSIALVILSETLLATTNFATKHDEKIVARREILAYAACNLSSAFCGCCPVNGSVSRTGIASQLGVKSQLMSLTAAFVMAAILLFGTGFISYLPVPVLTGIVISALIGTLEFSLARKLARVDRMECLIFYVAFFAVLFLGTIYGVIAGFLLSTITFIFRQSSPVTDFLGIVPAYSGYYSLTHRSSQARPLKGLVMYRFTGPLFYANISQFCEDILGTLSCPGYDTNMESKRSFGVWNGQRKDSIKAVLVDASGITSVDVSAAEKLVWLYEKLDSFGVKFYLAGHVSAVNDQLRAFGAGKLIENRCVRSKIHYALSDLGYKLPFTEDMVESAELETKYSNRKAEFDWAFGSDSEKKMTEIARLLAEEISQLSKDNNEIEISFLRKKEKDYSFGYWDEADEDEFLDILELQIEMLREQGELQTDKNLDEKILQRHIQLEESIMSKKAELIKGIVKRRYRRDARFKALHPKVAAHMELQYEHYFEELAMLNPQLAKELADIISEEEKKLSDPK